MRLFHALGLALHNGSNVNRQSLAACLPVILYSRIFACLALFN